MSGRPSLIYGYMPDLPRREPPKLAVGPAPKDLPKCQWVKNNQPLDVPERMGRLVFEGEAARDDHGNRRVRLRCAVEHGGCGQVFTMLARYYGTCRRGHCGCLGQGEEAHPALDQKLTLEGRTLPLVAHVREALGRGVRIDFQTVKRRILDGWDPARAATTPMRRWHA